MPQAYLDVIRDDIYDFYPVEMGYEAIRMIMTEMRDEETFFVEENQSGMENFGSISDDFDLSDYEVILLTGTDYNFYFNLYNLFESVNNND